MRIWKRALIHISQHKGKSLLLLTIITIVMTFIVSSNAIQQATGQASEQVKQSLNPEVEIRADMEKLMTAQSYPGAIISKKLIEDVKKSKYFKDIIVGLQAYVHTPYEVDYGSLGDITQDPYYESSTTNPMSNSLVSISENTLGKFANNINKLIDGEFPYESDAKSPVLISKKYSEDNDFKLNDEITMNTGEKLDIPEKLTVVGIFDSYEKSGMEMPFELENNKLYTTLEVVEEANKNVLPDGFELDYDSIRVILDNPDNIPAFVEEIKAGADNNDYLSFI